MRARVKPPQFDLAPGIELFRKGYSEALYRQDTETFLRCLENGLRSFGGSPLLLNLDNFKAAVRNANWFNPDINPKLADFAVTTACMCCPAVPEGPNKSFELILHYVKYLVMRLLDLPEIHSYERTSRAGLRAGFRTDSRLDR